MIKQEITQIVHDVLMLPKPYGWSLTNCKANKIVRAVFKAITEALQRGEEVEIKGLGIFRVRTRKPIKKYVQYWYGRRDKRTPRILRKFKAKKYVHFIPSSSIIKELNESQSS